MNHWTIEEEGQTIGIFNTAEDATEYAARVMRLAASIEVDHGDHDEIYLYASQEALAADTQGMSPQAVVHPCDQHHIPTYRA